MAEEEVKIQIRTEADNRGAIDAKAKILELREEAARLRQSAEVYSAKGGFEDPRARSARSEAAAREREANRLERPINTEAKTSQKTERDEKAQSLREERAAMKAAAREAAEEKKKFAAEDKAASNTAKAAEKAAAREAAEEKRKFAAEDKAAQKADRDEKAKALREQRAATSAAAREEKAEKAAARAEETQQQSTSRMLFGSSRGMAGGLVSGGAAAGLGYVLNEGLTEYTERQGIALRAAAQRTMDERGLAIAASWRGSSSQSLAQVHGLDDDIARQEANRPELERKANTGTLKGALIGGGAGGSIGGSIGAGIGSVVPGIGTVVGWGIGTAIGTLVGGAAGAYHGHAEGEREKDEDSKTLELKRKKREELEALGKKQVREEDGQIEMDIASHRAERTMSGHRAGVIDEAKKKYLNRYRDLRGMFLSDEEANKTAGLEAETAMRERQANAGASLVTAHSGAGDIAAAAAWGGMTTPGMAELKAEMAAFHQTVKGNSAAMEALHKTKDQSIK